MGLSETWTKVKDKDVLFCTIDGFYLDKLKEVIEKYNFKDVAAFFRFTTSLLIETEDNVLWIKQEGELVRIGVPAHSLKTPEETEIIYLNDTAKNS